MSGHCVGSAVEDARKMLEAVQDARDAQREARLIAAHVLGMPALEVALHKGEAISPRQWGDIEAFARRRALGEPLQYILGRAPFLDLTLIVAPGVLIPRPETEELTLWAMAFLKGRGEGARALDLCTGSGAIALALASAAPGLHVDAGDISERALDIARQNAQRLQLADRVKFYQGDLFAAVPPMRYDVIVSNPPYGAQDAPEMFAADVWAHEPREALLGGADGLDFYRRIAMCAPQYLKADGALFVEVGIGQANAVAEMLAGRFQDITIARDLQGVERMVRALL